MNSGNSPMEDFLRAHKVPVKRITYRGKKDIPKAFLQILYHFRHFKTDIAHGHSFDATVAGLPAAKLAGIKMRIYTRHHSDLHHTYHPSGKKYDRLNNRVATHIVAISQMVKNILTNMEHVPDHKITLIPHGFKLEEFDNVDAVAVERLRQKYNPIGKRPVIGVIARQTEWKGVQHIIPAFEKLLKKYPEALLILANASGDYKQHINHLLSKIPSQNYKEIVFENELFPLYKLFDVFVHVPISPLVEAYGQTYVEALAAGVPSVFTLSGIAQDFVVHKHNALVVNFNDSDEIYDAVLELLENNALKNSIIENGKQVVWNRFQFNSMIQAIEKLYSTQ